MLGEVELQREASFQRRSSSSGRLETRTAQSDTSSTSPRSAPLQRRCSAGGAGSEAAARGSEAAAARVQSRQEAAAQARREAAAATEKMRLDRELRQAIAAGDYLKDHSIA